MISFFFQKLFFFQLDCNYHVNHRLDKELDSYNLENDFETDIQDRPKTSNTEIYYKLVYPGDYKSLQKLILHKTSRKGYVEIMGLKKIH